MGWFSSPRDTTDDPLPVPVRLASAEFVSALVEVKQLYERRAEYANKQITEIAAKLAAKTNWNYGDMGQSLDETRRAVADKLANLRLADEMQNWINSYEHRGRRPPYMPELPTVDPHHGPDGSYGE